MFKRFNWSGGQRRAFYKIAKNALTLNRKRSTIDLKLLARSSSTTLFAAILFCAVKSADAQTPYYQGKTLTIVVGTVAGDLYDFFARAFAQHMGKHIPGNPAIIVQNMPGAGHMIAANYLYSVAKRTV